MEHFFKNQKMFHLCTFRFWKRIYIMRDSGYKSLKQGREQKINIRQSQGNLMTQSMKSKIIRKNRGKVRY